MPRPDLWIAPPRPLQPPPRLRLPRQPRQPAAPVPVALVDLLPPPDEEAQVVAIARELRRPLL